MIHVQATTNINNQYGQCNQYGQYGQCNQCDQNGQYGQCNQHGIRESMVDCLRDQLIPPASLLVSGRDFSRPGNQETSRWDPAGHADNQPWITFLAR